MARQVQMTGQRIRQKQKAPSLLDLQRDVLGGSFPMSGPIGF
jgi:hypothetical protein